MRPTLALAMISLNEEKNLPVLLKSVEGCFDSIYLADDLLTQDKTKQVAQDYGCSVFDVQWTNNFSEARNISFAPVKEDYICWLDCDDSLLNKEAFLHWRDQEMHKANLWMVPYHYAPGVMIERERVVKNMGFRWKYFVHEGIDPFINGKVPPCGRDHTWSVQHRRVDFLSSNKRNLKLFEANLDHLDARMQFYYGKELFAGGQTKKAFQYLNKVVMDPKLDCWEHERCRELLETINF